MTSKTNKKSRFKHDLTRYKEAWDAFSSCSTLELRALRASKRSAPMLVAIFLGMISALITIMLLTLTRTTSADIATWSAVITLLAYFASFPIIASLARNEARLTRVVNDLLDERKSK